MLITLLNKKQIDLYKPIDISIPLDGNSTTAWYVEHATIEPVRGDGFVGKVSEGGNVNFNSIVFNPHGHGTHTECVGHISPEFYSINQTLTAFHFEALLISIVPQEFHGEETKWRKKVP